MVIDSASADKPAGIDDLAGRDLLSVLGKWYLITAYNMPAELLMPF